MFVTRGVGGQHPDRWCSEYAAYLIVFLALCKEEGVRDALFVSVSSRTLIDPWMRPATDGPRRHRDLIFVAAIAIVNDLRGHIYYKNYFDSYLVATGSIVYIFQPFSIISVECSNHPVKTWTAH